MNPDFSASQSSEPDLFSAMNSDSKSTPDSHVDAIAALQARPAFRPSADWTRHLRPANAPVPDWAKPKPPAG